MRHICHNVISQVSLSLDDVVFAELEVPVSLQSVAGESFLDFKRNFGLLKCDLLQRTFSVRPFVVIKTESCSTPWSRFLATLIAEQLAEVPTNVFQDRIQQRTLEQISDTLVLVEVFSFLQRQGSTAFWGADLPYSRYFTRCQEGHFRTLLFVPRRAPVDLFETNKEPIGWSHRRPKIRDQKLSSGLLLMFMATHLLEFTLKFLSNIACSL